MCRRNTYAHFDFANLATINAFWPPDVGHAQLIEKLRNAVPRIAQLCQMEIERSGEADLEGFTAGNQFAETPAPTLTTTSATVSSKAKPKGKEKTSGPTPVVVKEGDWFSVKTFLYLYKDGYRCEIAEFEPDSTSAEAYTFADLKKVKEAL
jgi:hypothetical protein